MSTDPASSRDYEYDIFLSYKRNSASEAWVYQHFYPLLNRWLPEYMPRSPRIFVDVQEIETGTRWETVIKNALRNSRCLLPVWSFPYFQSAWCRAELLSIVAREKALLPSLERGLIFAIEFCEFRDPGGEFDQHFPEMAEIVNAVQCQNFSEWAITGQAFQETSAYVEFEKQVKLMMPQLKRMIDQAPAWQPNFPIVDPKTLNSIPQPKVRKPEFS